MQPQVVIRRQPQLILAGLSFFGDPFHSHAGWTEANEIGRLWQRLLTSVQTARQLSVMYEVHVQNDETLVTGEFEVFVGYEVSALDVSYQLCVKILPETEYAVFTFPGTQVHQDEPVVDNWLRANGYRTAYPFYLQQYDQRFKGMDNLDESVIDFLVPVRRDG